MLECDKEVAESSEGLWWMGFIHVFVGGLGPIARSHRKEASKKEHV